MGNNDTVGVAEVPAARLRAALDAGPGFAAEEIVPVLCDGAPVLGKDREPAVVTVRLRVLDGVRTTAPAAAGVGSLGVGSLSRFGSVGVGSVGVGSVGVGSYSRVGSVGGGTNSRVGSVGVGGGAGCAAWGGAAEAADARQEPPGRLYSCAEDGAPSGAGGLEIGRPPAADSADAARRLRFRQRLEAGALAGSARVLQPSLKTVLEEASEVSSEAGDAEADRARGGDGGSSSRSLEVTPAPAPAGTPPAAEEGDPDSPRPARGGAKGWRAVSEGAGEGQGGAVVATAVLAAEVAVALEGVVRREMGRLSVEVFESVGATAAALRAEMSELRALLSRPVSRALPG